MTIKRADYQFQPGLFEIEEYETEDGNGSEISPAEAKRRSETARQVLFARIRQNATEIKEGAEPEGVAWFDVLLELINGQWPWRLAVYIAWSASPRTGRWPRTQEELATQVLGLTSDRQIATWRRKNPAIIDMISDLQAAPMLEHRADVIKALIDSATTPDYKNHSDRKLLLEITGDYIPTSKLVAHVKRSMPDGADGMSDEELLRRAGYDTDGKKPEVTSDAGSDETSS